MQLRRFDNPKDFWHYAQAYLLRYEAEHNLMLSLVRTLIRTPERYPEPPYLVICFEGETTSEGVDDLGSVVAIALRTPPHKVVLSKVQNFDALKLIAEDVKAYWPDWHLLPGVSGLVEEVEAFLQTWQTLTEQPYQRTREMRIHALTQVQPMAPVTGHLRRATEADRPLLLEWLPAFGREIDEPVSEDPERLIELGLKKGSIYLWEDGEPVSWASGSQSLPTGARIGPVYTPPEHRRKGYATACVAALSQKLLDDGYDRCYLFTDLANPTSNHIYWEIGYRPLCDWNDYTFLPPASIDNQADDQPDQS
ncbi:GNAT family N-acetyltransferase [Vacuolonema iberomarrocanum]|uniref:GNAT family N-acetyltransferase n=1 Tax=Vacuolonema iberomarrocanum TaxID=3454632 RepID=UPI0019FBFE63|nr:GNAT family N-acetyltransferase [filamentous cyanobacterium LEGE 07170]